MIYEGMIMLIDDWYKCIFLGKVANLLQMTGARISNHSLSPTAPPQLTRTQVEHHLIVRMSIYKIVFTDSKSQVSNLKFELKDVASVPSTTTTPVPVVKILSTNLELAVM